MPKLKDQRYDFVSSKRTFDGCTCTENTLRFYYCKCGARQAEMTAMANEIILDLSDEQVEAMTATTGGIERRTANRLGYDLERLGLSSGFSRSGDNADYFTDLGKVTQDILRNHQRVMDILEK